jgi:prevent-host-death family protein
MNFGEASVVKQYSIDEARDHFAAVVEEAEHGARVEVMREGRPVAVLLSLDALVSSGREGFWEAYEGFRQKYDLTQLEIDPDEVFADVRETSLGRRFEW